MLLDASAAQRATLEMKCAGLGDDVGLRSAEPSALFLIGLVRHLADVERRWFRRVLADHDAPALSTSPDDPDGDFDGAANHPATVDASWASWRAEVAYAEHFCTEIPHLDVGGRDSWRGTVSLRWVLIHMIEEYACHNGHADLLRERVDGATGIVSRGSRTPGPSHRLQVPSAATGSGARLGHRLQYQAPGFARTCRRGRTSCPEPVPRQQPDPVRTHTRRAGAGLTRGHRPPAISVEPGRGLTPPPAPAG
ncbi:DinB family protein [Streptomyces sp. NPDC005931]|uniref:DinB family protein n=1 Tax=Streptomyces sp. NPDC005931 TaxID=3364737 RepID=UPI0036CE50C7